MKETMRKSGLLEYIAERAGCGYLSDLHSKKKSFHIYRVITDIAPSDYDLKEWEDAVRYIIEKKVSFEDSEQAADYLLTYLKKQIL